MIGEIHVAANIMGKNKALGDDGVPLEYFLEFWEHLGPIFLITLL